MDINGLIWMIPPLFAASEAAARSKKNHQVPSLKVGAGVRPVAAVASTCNAAAPEVSQNWGMFLAQIIQVFGLAIQYCIPSMIPWFFLGSQHIYVLDPKKSHWSQNGVTSICPQDV